MPGLGVGLGLGLGVGLGSGLQRRSGDLPCGLVLPHGGGALLLDGVHPAAEPLRAAQQHLQSKCSQSKYSERRSSSWGDR